MQNVPSSEPQHQAQPAATPPTPRKKTSRGEWFKRVVSGLIAIVTILGAWVAWRAQVASSEAGDNDAQGILALQNDAETVAVSYIEANSHEIAYTDYLRNRSIAIDKITDTIDNPPADPDKVYLEIKRLLDIARTSKVYFFPGQYLDRNDDYDFNREINELYAQAEQSKDLNYQRYFDRSDYLSNKVMALIALLIILAAALWLFAISEILSSAVKYSTAFGGLIFLLIGGISAYLVESEVASPADISSIIIPTSWVVGALIVVAIAGMSVVVFISNRKSKVVTVASTPAGPQMPPPGTFYPPSGYPAPIPTNPDGTPLYIPPGTPPPPHGYTGPIATSPPSAVATVPPVAQTTVEENDEKEEPFKQIVTILIATVALIAALIAYLQSDASNQAGSANRNVQQYSLTALGERTYGASQLGYFYYTGAYTWKQLDVLARSAENNGEEIAATQYRNVMSKLSTRSSLFDKEYYDPETDVLPDVYSFAADLYLSNATSLSESSEIQSQLHNAWDAKASAYIAHLTLLAVALALLGLSLASSSFVRYIFGVVGVLMVSTTIVWAITTYAKPITSISDSAIDAYAIGVGHNYAGRFQEAIDSLNEALAIEPGYGNALTERGDAYINQAYAADSDAYFSMIAGNTDEATAYSQESDEKLQAAINDYETARTAGKDDIHVGWQLGWAYYLQGKYNEALDADDRVLGMDPNVTGVRLNKAITLLAQGNYEEAEQEYNIAIARTTDLINKARDEGKTLSSDFWYYLNAGVTDLFNLVLRMGELDFYFVQASPRNTIADPATTSEEALAMILKLRDKIAAFEALASTGEMPENVEPDAVIDEFEFNAIVKGQEGEQTGTYFPSNTTGVSAHVKYQNIHPGQRVAFKVYINFNHTPEYDLVIDSYEGEESGEDTITVTDPFDEFSDEFTMAQGLYTIEMYVDNKYVQSGFFYVQTPAEDAAVNSNRP